MPGVDFEPMYERMRDRAVKRAEGRRLARPEHPPNAAAQKLIADRCRRMGACWWKSEELAGLFGISHKGVQGWLTTQTRAGHLENRPALRRKTSAFEWRVREPERWA